MQKNPLTDVIPLSSLSEQICYEFKEIKKVLKKRAVEWTQCTGEDDSHNAGHPSTLCSFSNCWSNLQQLCQQQDLFYNLLGGHDFGH